MGELIDAIEARRLRWAIATSSRKAQVTASVASLGLRAEPMIVDASHVEHAKPEPDLLLLAADQLGVAPARCWYIGDSTWDMVSAVAAGMIPIGVTAGARGRPARARRRRRGGRGREPARDRGGAAPRLIGAYASGSTQPSVRSTPLCQRAMPAARLASSIAGSQRRAARSMPRSSSSPLQKPTARPAA